MSQKHSASDDRRTVPLLLIVVLAALRFALPLATLHPSWEFHRDEFLYFAMADHFDLFRMQFPPLIAMVAGAGRAVFGESVFAARVPAALAGAALTAVVLWFVRRLGGSTRALVLAWLALLAAPVFVRSSVLLQPVILDQLWATLAIAALTLAAHEREPRWWMLVGLALGLGALTKFSVAFIAVTIGVAAVFTSDLRGHLRTRWPWIAVLIAAVLATPSVAGQVVHGWPFLQQMRALHAGQLAQLSVVGFLAEQPMLLSAALVCALPALLCAVRGGVRERVPVAIVLCMLMLMLVLHGKAYYAAPVYPVLIGIGALHLGGATETRRWVMPVATLTMLAGAIVLWPIGVPIFDATGMASYFRRMGLAQQTNRGEAIDLPQDFADMTGWLAISDSVGSVVSRLPAGQQADLSLIGSNYGEAGALAFYHRSRRLPYPRSAAGDFWAWGPGSASGNQAIVIGPEREIGEVLRKLYDSVDVVSVVRNPIGVAEERVVSIFHARGARTRLAALWPSLGPNWE